VERVQTREENEGEMEDKEMNNKRRRTIGVTTCLFVLFISGIGTSAIEQTTVATGLHQDSGVEDVIVQILDDSYINEKIVTLTRQKASELELLIETISKRLQTATEREEIWTIYHEALSWLQTLGLMNQGQETEKILQVWGRRTSMQSIKNEWPSQLQDIHLNALCCLAGDTTVTRFAGFRTITLLRIGLWLHQRGFSWLFIDLLLMTSLFVDSVKPVSRCHRMLLGEFGLPTERLANGWIVTCGITGIRKSTGWMRGTFGCNFVTEFTGAFGFTGIKIIHNRGSKTFYLGSALFVCIKQ
jgi:hypothetical protein